MGSGPRCWRLAREHRLAAWACLSALLFMSASMWANVRHLPGSQDPAAYAVAGAVYLALAVLYRFPAVTVAVSAAGSVALIAMGIAYPITMPAVFGSLFVFALTSDRRRTLAVALPVKLALFVAHMIAVPGIAGLVVVLWAALATTLGNAARNHRAYVAEVEDRARRAEQAKEDEANRRVAEERLRIARELHDVVGHHVALISVQAGAMSCLLAPGQGQARESLAHIQRASADALEDLRMTVGLLREPGAGEPVEPLPGLGQLDELICSFASAGLLVTREVTGQARTLPEPVELTAYRVIQESLTNTRKHAEGGSALVRLGYAPGRLRVAVEDEGNPQAFPEGRAPEGHGIVGMRERVTALGGRLSVGPRPEGGFRVVAELPLPAAGP